MTKWYECCHLIIEKTGKPQIVKEFPATAQSHGFNDIVDNYAGYAIKIPLNNVTLYQLDGSLNGVAGRFEWIIQDGNVTQNVYSKWNDEWSADKIMIKIADIKELKLNITWRMLYRGLLEKQISISEIVEYAMEQLEKGDDRIEICELAGSRDHDVEDAMNTLYELANEKKLR